MDTSAALVTCESEMFDFLSDLNDTTEEFFEVKANYRGLTFTVIGSGRDVSRWINVDDVNGLLDYQDSIPRRIQIVRDLTLLADFADERARKAQR